jgi:HlyD family secretion protein
MRPRSSGHFTRYGQSSLIVVGIIVVVMVLAAAGLFLRSSSDASERSSQSDYFRVRKGGFDITLPVSGELAALKQIEIRNNLDSRAIITEIITEGTYVNAGDIVLRLNDDEVRNQLREAQDKVNVADSALIAAQAKLEIEVKARDLAVQLAELALKAWQEGEAKTKLEELQLAVQTTVKEHQRLFDRYEQSKELVKKEFISQDELRKDEIAMMQAEFDLAKAKNELMVYQEYQFYQDQAQKLSDLEQARIEREAEIRSARSDVDSKQFQLDSAREKLAELQQQLTYCTVIAPAPGLIVYHSSTQSGMGRNEGRPPMVGTEISRNEPVIIIPDTSKMVAAVKVSEALVGQIQIGQRASVSCDAMPDQSITGRVQSVGVLAESGGWRDPNRRDYTVKILLNNGADLGLKPAMRCKANLSVGRVEDALHVPIQAVFRNGPLSYVYVPQGGGFAQKKVITGRSSELYIEITEGLEEGDTVLLRQPAPEEIVSRLPVPNKPAEQPLEEEVGAAEMDAPMPGIMQDNGGGPTNGPPSGMRRGGNRTGAGMRPEGGGRGPGGGENTGGGRGNDSAQRDAGSTPQPVAPAAPAPTQKQ